MDKKAQNNYPIHVFLKNRWSPRSFSEQPVEKDKLMSLFEAARWSPSGSNVQPWRFIVTTQAAPEPFNKLLSTLSEWNQVWAKNVPVLMLSIAQLQQEDGKKNPSAIYDLGQSVAHFSIQASISGLFVHQMGGFDSQKAVELFGLPEEFIPVTVIAVGYLGDPAALPERLREREMETRARRPMTEFVFDGKWNEPLK